jgi:hypothetical protein
MGVHKVSFLALIANRRRALDIGALILPMKKLDVIEPSNDLKEAPLNL